MTGKKTSRRPRWYVLGASGFVGSYVYQLLQNERADVIGSAYPEDSAGLTPVDITNASHVEQFFTSADQDDIVIHAAAQANVDVCEKHSQLGHSVNVRGTQNVVECLKSRAPRYLFFSTEYIFDGHSGPYSEADTPHPLNHYGRQKLLAEHYLQQHLPKALIIRTTTVFGYEKAAKNFLMSCLARLKTHQPVKIPVDQISTPTYVKDVAAAVIDLARRPEVTGVINIAGSERLSRFAFAQKIAAAFNIPSGPLLAVPTKELHQLANRPLNAGLRIDRLQSLGYTMQSVDTALAEIKTQYGSHLA